MGQITIYLDRETEERLNTKAQAAGVSVNRWLTELIQESTSAGWPAEIRSLAGAWQDFPEPEELRREQADDVRRESL
jgi:hypothetical protein